MRVDLSDVFKMGTICIDNIFYMKHTTTDTKGAREKPFPSLSTISASMLFLLTKHLTKTAIPTPASITS